MSGVASGRGLVGENRDFRLLFLSTLASSIGTWLAVVALVLDIYDRTSSAAWVSALLIAEFAPLVLIGLLAGPLLDRLPRRRVLIASDLSRAAIFLVLPFATSSLQIVLLALAAGAATSFFRPAVYAGLPNLVSEGELPRANGLLQAADNVTLSVGPVLGGLLVAWTGTGPAYVLNSLSFVVSAGLILGIRRSFEEGHVESEGHWQDLRSGLGLLTRSRALRTVVVVWAVFMLGSAGVSVAEVVLAKEVFAAGDAGYGLMLGAMGLGIVIGSLAGGSLAVEHGLRGLYAVALGSMALGVGAAAAAPNVWVAAPLLVFAGLGNGAALVCNALFIQRGVPDHLRGRAFTVAMSLSYAALGLGMVVAGPLTDALGPRDVWALAAVTIAACVPFALVLARDTSAVITPAAGGAPEPVVDTVTASPERM
ncbi:MAG: MFS transporter [Gaiellales bacterium]